MALDYNAVFLVAVTLIVFFVPVFLLFPPLAVQPSDALSQTHSKLGLSRAESNLRRQHEASEYRSRPGGSAKIRALYIYPIKSCRGVELATAKVLPGGVQYDRLYTFAHLKTKKSATASGEEQTTTSWEFQTLRQLPLLANVKVDVWLPDATKKRPAGDELAKLGGGFIVVRFPWTDGGLQGLCQRVVAKLRRGLSGTPEKEFMLPLDFPSQQEIAARGYKYDDVTIWKDSPSALNMENELPPELARYLGVSNRLGLFRMDPSKKRQVFRCAPRKEEIGYQPVVSFQDGYPIHLLSLTSLRALESNIIKDQTINRLDARRFRANIIMSGLDEYDEDDWKDIRFQSSTDKTMPQTSFSVACRTVRCKLPNVDPATGIKHKVEPDRSLRKFRDIDEGAPKMGCLGMQLCPKFIDTSDTDHLESQLQVGMEIDVVTRGAHFYLKQ